MIIRIKSKQKARISYTKPILKANTVLSDREICELFDGKNIFPLEYDNEYVLFIDKSKIKEYLISYFKDCDHEYIGSYNLDFICKVVYTLDKIHYRLGGRDLMYYYYGAEMYDKIWEFIEQHNLFPTFVDEILKVDDSITIMVRKCMIKYGNL